MNFHHNMKIASQWVQPHCLYQRIHMVPGHILPVTVCVFMLPLLGRIAVEVMVLLLIQSGDIETNPGPVGESSGLACCVCNKLPLRGSYVTRGHVCLGSVLFPDCHNSEEGLGKRLGWKCNVPT